MINRVIMTAPVSAPQFGTARSEKRQLVTNLSDNLNNAFNPELQLEEKLKALKVAEGLLFKLW